MEYKWTALTVTIVGTLMGGIDARIVVVGLPTIAQQLHAGAEEVVWITQANVLASTVCLFMIGRLTDLFGRIKLYKIGFIIFTVGSTCSALSFNVYEVIAFRILQGIGSGILVTSSAAIITDASPKTELGTMLGINLTGFRSGNVLGLTLSGVILSFLDWRGLFYVNIPIGVFGTIWAHKRLKEISTKDPVKKMDWLGFGQFTTGLTMILLAITYLGYGIAGSLEGYSLLLTGLILVAFFIKRESGISYPLLDLQLFKIKLFAAGNFAQVLNSLTWFGMIVLIVFYMQIGLGYTPLQAGLGILPLDGTYLISSLISAKLSDKYGTRGLSTLGLAINTVGYIIVTTFSQSTHYSGIAFALLIVGIGNGMFNTPNIRAIMGSVPPHRRGIASAFRNTVFNVGATASYGLVILLITFGIPYSTFSLLLQGAGSQSFLSLAKPDFLNGFRIATLVLTVIDAIAIIPSAMRGPKESEVLAP